MNDVQAQLAVEFPSLIHRLRGVVESSYLDALSEQLASNSDYLAESLQSDNDSIVGATAQAIVSALFGQGEPLIEWWTETPVGVICAKALLDQHQPISWSYGVAADVLGLAKGTISAVASRGRIDKHPRGGLVPASVLTYGEERRPHKAHDPRERDYSACGTVEGYHQHHYHNETTCQPCRDAWNLHRKGQQ